MGIRAEKDEQENVFVGHDPRDFTRVHPTFYTQVYTV